jgi:hypothetical protein
MKMLSFIIPMQSQLRRATPMIHDSSIMGGQLKISKNKAIIQLKTEEGAFSRHPLNAIVPVFVFISRNTF